MRAVITAKSELRLSDLTREYVFDIVDDEGVNSLPSQVVRARPSDAASVILAIVDEYELAATNENDVEIGDLI